LLWDFRGAESSTCDREHIRIAFRAEIFTIWSSKDTLPTPILTCKDQVNLKVEAEKNKRKKKKREESTVWELVFRSSAEPLLCTYTSSHAILAPSDHSTAHPTKTLPLCLLLCLCKAQGWFEI
jgi:hypothetical protein